MKKQMRKKKEKLIHLLICQPSPAWRKKTRNLRASAALLLERKDRGLGGKQLLRARATSSIGFTVILGF